MRILLKKQRDRKSKTPPRYTDPKGNEITKKIPKTRSLRSQTEGILLNESLKALERFHQPFVTGRKECEGGMEVGTRV